MFAGQKSITASQYMSYFPYVAEKMYLLLYERIIFLPWVRGSKTRR